jgi:hypothetical protein
MFGFTSFSQTPFSDAGPAYFFGAATVVGESALFADTQVFVQASATIASESNIDCFAIRYGVGGATIVGESDVIAKVQRLNDASGQIDAASSLTADAMRYALGASIIASESDLDCFAIRYGVGGATIVGESDINAVAIRYAICRATVVSESELIISPNSIISQSALIKAVSQVDAKIAYTTKSSGVIVGASAIIAAARKKWESEPDVAEVWVDVPDTPSAWTPVPDTGEIWNNVR